jgi:hypothetical protein
MEKFYNLSAPMHCDKKKSINFAYRKKVSTVMVHNLFGIEKALSKDISFS